MRKLRYSKTLKRLLKPLVYMAVFWIFMDILPNTSFSAGPVSKVIASFGFFVAYHIGHFILGFFRLKRNNIARFIMSSATTTGYLWLIDKYMPNILRLSATYVGDTDLIIWQIPKLFEITDIYYVYIFCALILTFCCIIIEISIKRN